MIPILFQQSKLYMKLEPESGHNKAPHGSCIQQL